MENKGTVISNMVFWAAAFLLFFWALGDRGLWASEGRWAEITREMLISGDYFHPTINGEPYFDKPLLTYWFVALFAALTGRLDAWMVRLPSAISGLLGLWATVYLGRKLWSPQVGRTAGWLLFTTYGILFWARTGTADMENLAAITLAVAWYWTRRARPNFRTWFVFYLICVLGAHSKGLTAFVVPVLAVLPDLLREQRWRNLLTASHLLSLVINSSIYFAPYIYSGMTREGYPASGLGLVFQENILRYFQPFDHKEPFYVYFYYLPLLFLPWIPLLLSALWGTYASLKKQDEKTRWLAEAVVVIFLFFTCSGSRRSYYILPLLPFCALLVSVFLNKIGEEKRKCLGLGLQAMLFFVISMIEILSVVAWPILKQRAGFVPPRDTIIAMPVLGLLALVFLILGRIRPGLQAHYTGTDKRMAPLFAMATIIMGGFFCWQNAGVDNFRSEKPFAMELKAQIAELAPEEIAFYRKISPNVLFYLASPRPIRMLKDADSVRSFLESASVDRVLVLRREYLEDLLPVFPAALSRKPTVSEKIYPWDNKGSRKLVAWKINGKEK